MKNTMNSMKKAEWIKREEERTKETEQQEW